MNDLSIISDAHKDAYGYRPSPDAMVHWASLPAADFEAVQAEIFRDVQRSMADDAARQAAAAEAFEAHIRSIMADHGVNRETAVRWDMQAHDAGQDTGYFEYLNGLPYDYLNGSSQ